MAKKFLMVLIAAVALICFGIPNAHAGAKVEIGDDSSIDLGFRLQTQFLNFDDPDNKDADAKFKRVSDFNVRRARVRLKGDVTKWVSMFIQTEFSEGATDTSADMRIIDAFVEVKPHRWIHLIAGENMAPAMRINVTSSGALMTIDRPGITYKNLTWGLKHRAAFTNVDTPDTAPLSGSIGTASVGVRDMGATLFGSDKLTDLVSGKYYIGVYDGIQPTGEDDKRITGRVQVNLFDPEPGYYNSDTYLGMKKTVAVGGAFDTQSNVATGVDYTMWTLDAFTDYPVGPGSVTAQVAYADLDLDDNAAFLQSQGNGLYFELGYYWNKWQPWFEYEYWDSDASASIGDFDAYRFGVSYYLKGHNAACKVGYEIVKAKENFTTASDNEIGSFLVGLYVTY